MVKHVLRPGRRRKRSCSPGLPSAAPIAKPKPKDPHENGIHRTIPKSTSPILYPSYHLPLQRRTGSMEGQTTTPT